MKNGGCGPVPHKQEPPPNFPQASTELAPVSVSYSLPLTIRNTPWVGFVDTWPHVLEDGEGTFPWARNMSGSP